MYVCMYGWMDGWMDGQVMLVVVSFFFLAQVFPPDFPTPPPFRFFHFLWCFSDDVPEGKEESVCVFPLLNKITPQGSRHQHQAQPALSRRRAPVTCKSITRPTPKRRPIANSSRAVSLPRKLPKPQLHDGVFSQGEPGVVLGAAEPRGRDILRALEQR